MRFVSRRSPARVRPRLREHAVAPDDASVVTSRRAWLAWAGATLVGGAPARAAPPVGASPAGHAVSRSGASPAVPGMTGAPSPSPSLTSLPSSSPQTLQLQPFGPVPARQLDLIGRALTATFDFRIARLPVLSMPAEAYYLPRKRYRAELILAALMKQTRERILAVTALDISTTKEPVVDWGILGLGTIGGRTAVVSSYRCRRRAPSTRVAEIRLAKVAVHEIGHTLGLPHCPHRGCLMEDAAGSVLTTDRERDLCPTCRARLATLGFAVKRGFAWPG